MKSSRFRRSARSLPCRPASFDVCRDRLTEHQYSAVRRSSFDICNLFPITTAVTHAQRGRMFESFLHVIVEVEPNIESVRSPWWHYQRIGSGSMRPVGVRGVSCGSNSTPITVIGDSDELVTLVSGAYHVSPTNGWSVLTFTATLAPFAAPGDGGLTDCHSWVARHRQSQRRSQKGSEPPFHQVASSRPLALAVMVTTSQTQTEFFSDGMDSSRCVRGIMAVNRGSHHATRRRPRWMLRRWRWISQRTCSKWRWRIAADGFSSGSG